MRIIILVTEGLTTIKKTGTGNIHFKLLRLECFSAIIDADADLRKCYKDKHTGIDVSPFKERSKLFPHSSFNSEECLSGCLHVVTMLYLNATSLNFVEKGNMKNNFSVIQKGNSLVIYTEEYKSKNRHNVG